jgi:hypothetical protein
VKSHHYVTTGAVLLAAAALNVTLSGQRGEGQAPAAKVPPAHLHIGHVMTNWKETPSKEGFLPVAVADARVAVAHAGYMQKSPDNLDSVKLHAGHVLNALDPTLEAKGPGSGFGVKRATDGALQHLQFAAKAEGASKGVQTHATHVEASLNDVKQWTDEAIATAQKIRAATSASEAAPLVAQMIAQTNTIASGVDANKDGSIGWQTGEGGLAQAQQHMALMMKGEGLQ